MRCSSDSARAPPDQHLALAGVPGIRFLECPFNAVKLVDALWWHPLHNRDPAHEWMRSLFIEAGELLANGDEKSA